MNINTSPTGCHASGADAQSSLWVPPCSTVGRFICRCVGVASEAGSIRQKKTDLPISAGKSSILNASKDGGRQSTFTVSK